MHRGYIALWRKVKDHPFYQEPREFSKYEAWIDLLMEAQHEKDPQRVIIGMNVIECHYGESLKSVTTWANRWKWSRSKVFRFLKLLKKMDQIHFASETITTRIRIVNYECYDPRRNGKKTEEEQGRNGCETEAVTDKNVKNVKNKHIWPSKPENEYSPEFLEFWKHYPKKKAKGAAWKAWKKIKRPVETLVLIQTALLWQKKSKDWTKEGGQFVPHPATYLNAKGWEDEPQTGTCGIKTTPDWL